MLQACMSHFGSHVFSAFLYGSRKKSWLVLVTSACACILLIASLLLLSSLPRLHFGRASICTVGVGQELAARVLHCLLPLGTASAATLTSLSRTVRSMCRVCMHRLSQHRRHFWQPTTRWPPVGHVVAGRQPRSSHAAATQRPFVLVSFWYAVQRSSPAAAIFAPQKKFRETESGGLRGPDRAHRPRMQHRPAPAACRCVHSDTLASFVLIGTFLECIQRPVQSLSSSYTCVYVFIYT